MIEIRWVIVLALWTMLIGPIMDLSQQGPTAQSIRPSTQHEIKASMPR